MSDYYKLLAEEVVRMNRASNCNDEISPCQCILCEKLRSERQKWDKMNLYQKMKFEEKCFYECKKYLNKPSTRGEDVDEMWTNFIHCRRGMSSSGAKRC